MNLKDYLSQKLQEDGYDGLLNADTECGCRLDDFMPCGEPGENCEPGYAGPDLNEDGGWARNEDGCGWLMFRDRPEGYGPCSVCQSETTCRGERDGWGNSVWLCPDHGGKFRES